MQLKKLLTTLDLPNNDINCEINCIQVDSRKVAEGDLFFAYPGLQVDGRNFIEQAICNGAKAIVREQDVITKQLEVIDGIYFINLQNVTKKIGPIAATFYDNPSQKMQMIGITGTNGKTSICQMIAGCLHTNKHKVGVIGTIGNGIYGKLESAAYTTALTIDLQQLLSHFVEQNVKTVAMEVSSHGLEQNRVNSIEFTTAIFTNLSREHLDYHKSMEKYYDAKRKLFTMPNLKQAIICLDDQYGSRLAHEFSGEFPIIGYCLKKINNSNIPIVYAENIQQNSQGICADIITPWGETSLQTDLLGKFSLSNCLAVIATLCSHGMSLKTAINRLNKLPHVNGRMQILQSDSHPTVIVDYAHSPDALKKALSAIKEHFQHKIWCVFGCGGDRDKGKRPMMAKIAEQDANELVICNDNPRNEPPEQIINDIIKGLSQSEKATIIQDRAKAIEHAINSADKNDVILIAGKGHEDYQIIGSNKIHFSDIEEVQKCLQL